MVAKKIKESKTIKQEKPEITSNKYFYGLGRRKSSIAKVKIFLVEKQEKGIVVNGKNFLDYFSINRHQNSVKAPFVTAGKDSEFDVEIKVFGGGVTGQAEAARLGVARALVKFDASLKKVLKDAGFLTRDARVVERKKPGLKKARRAPQWAKR